MARARNATQKEIADANLTAKALETGPFKSIDYGDHVDVINRFGEVVSSGPKGISPKDEAKKDKADEQEAFAYSEIKADMQRQIDKAAELHNHPGLNKITGVTGVNAGKEGLLGMASSIVAGEKGLGAAELWTSVVGGTLLTGLAKLKQASKTGASGLGALSEAEGTKVQADAAALGRYQGTKSMQLRLRQYIESIAAGGARLDVKAQATGVPVIPLHIPPLNTGRNTPAPAAPAPTTPTAAPAGAPAGTGRRKFNPATGKIE